MGQVSAKLRSTTEGFIWWCGACGEAHPLPYKLGWTFDGDVDWPTFTPSFKHTGKQVILDPMGKWTGEWARDDKGNTKGWCCHYVVTKGQIAYCGDCTHSLAGQTVTMPDLPPHMCDEDF